MKVLLIEPPKRVWEMMGDCVAPPLGLAYVAGALEHEGIEVGIVDCNASKLTWSQLKEAIAEAEPDLVGATAMTTYFHAAARAMRIAKEIDPGIVTVLGGPHVTFLAQETLQEHPEVDFIVRGEGERKLFDLIRCLEGDGDPSTVQGIAFRQDGGVVQTPEPPPLDVNVLPMPAYHLLSMRAYRFEMMVNFTSLLTSRGCPHRCTFCAEWPFWGDGWRPRDPESVVEEIELLHRRYDRQSFWFGDDCFNVDGDHMRAISEGILKRGLEIAWFYQGRADLLIKHRDVLPLMRRAGNLMVQLGIEASTDGELSDLRKQLTVEQVREAVHLLRQNDIVCQGLLIIGTPSESAQSIQHKVRFAKWLDVDFPIFTVFTPFPGTEIYEGAKAKGWLEDPPDYSKYDMAHFLIKNEHLSRRELVSWWQWCFWSYYLDPIKLTKGLFSRNSWKRHIWRLMIGYNMKKAIRAWF